MLRGVVVCRYGGRPYLSPWRQFHQQMTHEPVTDSTCRSSPLLLSDGDSTGDSMPCVGCKAISVCVTAPIRPEARIVHVQNVEGIGVKGATPQEINDPERHC